MTTPASTLPTPDLSDPPTVLCELLDPDQQVRDEFARALAPELEALAAGLAASFAGLPPIVEAATRLSTQRAKLVAGFAIGVLDDLVVATKLLIAGKGPAAGNTMRQAIEGVAIATLCSAEAPLVLERSKKHGAVRACYWERMDQEHLCTRGHHALTQLEWNAVTLGVSADAIERLRAAQRHYHEFSHCGPVTIGLRTALAGPGVTWIGGHFDAAKLDWYRVEMCERIGLCRVLPEFWAYLRHALMPPASPAGSVA
ncbi:hypothetical protein [Burkholderia sp. LMG 32019]|uniref:hypothetical protein n=1 Tax=Burkholderia sp. LMG 32019 TaxID=3158173 RepID=UPI003C2B0ECE